MSMSNFGSEKKMRVSNPYGETPHAEGSYNLPDEDRDRKDLETAEKGRNAFVPIEEVEDEDAEAAIYNHVEESIEKKDVDQFGYMDMMNRIIVGLKAEEKDKFLDNSSVFLPLHRQIINDEHLSDEEKDKLLRDKFTKIFGHQVLAYDTASGDTETSLHKPEFVTAAEKAAPIYATKAKYDERGRPTTGGSSAQARSEKSKSKFRFPFGRSSK